MITGACTKTTIQSDGHQTNLKKHRSVCETLVEADSADLFVSCNVLPLLYIQPVLPGSVFMGEQNRVQFEEQLQQQTVGELLICTNSTITFKVHF